MNILFVREAQAELRAAVQHYQEQEPGLAAEFRDEIRVALERIIQLPSAHAAIGQGARRCRLKRFPYSVVYLEAIDSITVLAIAHARRQPGYWKGRG